LQGLNLDLLMGHVQGGKSNQRFALFRIGRVTIEERPLRLSKNAGIRNIAGIFET
jgi:hypothetical protein